MAGSRPLTSPRLGPRWSRVQAGGEPAPSRCAAAPASERAVDAGATGADLSQPRAREARPAHRRSTKEVQTLAGRHDTLRAAPEKTPVSAASSIRSKRHAGNVEVVTRRQKRLRRRVKPWPGGRPAVGPAV